MSRKRRETPKTEAERHEITLSASVTLGLILAVGLGLVIAYGRMVPAGYGPDEDSHLLFVQTLAGEVSSGGGWAWGLPVFETTGDGANFETHQPPLYYFTASLLYRIGGVTVVRWMSLACYLLLALVTYWLVSSLTSTDLALAATAFVAWLPMHAFLAWRPNNDSLTNLLWAIALWRWMIALRDGPSRTEGWRSGLAVGAALLCKQSSLGLLPLAVLAGLLCGWRTGAWRKAAEQTAICLGLALLLAGWWYLRNQVVYGDLLAQGAFDERFLTTRATKASLEQGPLGLRPEWSYWPYVFEWLVRTSVIYLGHQFFRLPMDAYGLHLTILAVCGGLGLVAQVKLARRAPRDARVCAGWLLGAGLLLAVAMLIKFNTVYFQAQGRYLNVMLPGWGVLLAGGASRVFAAGSPGRRYGLWLMPAWLGLLNLLFLAVYVPGLFDAP